MYILLIILIPLSVGILLGISVSKLINTWKNEAQRLQRLLNNGILVQCHDQDILGPISLEQLGLIIKYGGYDEWSDILSTTNSHIAIKVCPYQE